jgi:hypothetical protein
VRAALWAALVIGCASVAASVAAVYWAWQAGRAHRDIARIRAEREAAKLARRKPTAPTRILTPPPPARAMLPRKPFADPPRAIRAFHGHQLAYVKPPGRSSFGWRGAEWASPTSLDFETDVASAQIVGAALTLSPEPIHPTHLVQALERLWAQLRTEVAARRAVVDCSARLGVVIEPAGSRYGSMPFAIRVRVKCWPAIEGVTVPRRRGWDVTL